jgi:hypothetical protein
MIIFAREFMQRKTFEENYNKVHLWKHQPTFIEPMVLQEEIHLSKKLARGIIHDKLNTHATKIEHEKKSKLYCHN